MAIARIRTRIRRFTDAERDRLMGWPTDWTRWTANGDEIPTSHRQRLTGNGVIAPVAEWIGHNLAKLAP
jgi:site-specific DNA-cytosine methylase